ncbi:hypothetical protein Csp2054_08200 [Curtobacterium sp. 'Ferrero']|uniref:hypothetical protein n=1 Tax=Curtobacterium sp. 'Ferrero' TaxID=2033654 RepID=UPI000BC41CAF|nr:hypothetical protein [Curtobacterium sp. 'Ferrero']PCN48130.1 hypothetical protein Csp2054_08200 [Curtobacterium sp. 'Ferrero']
MVGIVGAGPRSGEYLYVFPYLNRGGRADAWDIETVDCGDLFDLDGNLLLEHETVDFPKPHAGSFIDEITDALDVEWTTDPAVVARVLRESFPRLAAAGDDRRGGRLTP